MRTGRSGKSGPRGAAAVEFAIVLPVLAVLVLGSIDWGYYFFSRQVVTNAAREGARAGSLQLHFSDAAGCTTCGAYTDAYTRCTGYVTNAQIGNGTTTCTVAVAADTVTVTANYWLGGGTRRTLTGFTLDFAPTTVTATAVMRR